MKFLKTISLALCLAATLCAAAQTNFQATAAKAQRYFDNREWANASALYTIMLHEQPQTRHLYGKAIVVTSILNDTIRSQQLLRQALSYNVPLDSVMSDVREFSFIAGEPRLYENFLLRSARENEWMRRAINTQLLKYYTFRSDGPEMEKYALMMLNGAPDNTSFLLTLAEAYLIQGKTDAAVATWQKITTADPGNYDALINLANYYAIADRPDEALPLYARAFDLRPTPYVQAAIARLTPTDN